VDIARQRLTNQHVASPTLKDPAAVVSWLGAVQAQDYLGGLWAVGLRTRDATARQVERALARGAILRTWPMRGTLHIVAAKDARWMLDLLAGRVIKGTAGRRRELEIDAGVVSRSRKLVVKALEGGRQVTRSGLYDLLEAAGIATRDGRGLHILMGFALEGLICFAAREGKQQTFALLAEWAPGAGILPRDEALGELARRYFTSHGPATWRDFAWWSGLRAADAREAIQLARTHLTREIVDDGEFWHVPSSRRAAESTLTAAHLLPPFDEFTVAYKDRSAALHPHDAGYAQSGGMISPVIVINGRVVGTWKRMTGTGTVNVAATFFRTCTLDQHRLVSHASNRYGRFLGLTPALSEPRQVERVDRDL
jgi:DNA glycosylase AlkZ-like